MMDGLVTLLDKFLEVVKAIGTGPAVGVVAGGVVLWWLLKDAAPRIWSDISPLLIRYLEARVSLVERQVGSKSLSPTATNAAELIKRAGETSGNDILDASRR